MPTPQTDKQASHTPTPWAVATGAPLYIHGNYQWIASAMGLRGPEGEANIAFIVRAVNAIYPLAALARSIVDIAKDGTWEEDTEWLVERARAALKLTGASE